MSEERAQLTRVVEHVETPVLSRDLDKLDHPVAGWVEAW
jgi:hypothetical protein